MLALRLTIIFILLVIHSDDTRPCDSYSVNNGESQANMPNKSARTNRKMNDILTHPLFTSRKNQINPSLCFNTQHPFLTSPQTYQAIFISLILKTRTSSFRHYFFVWCTCRWHTTFISFFLVAGVLTCSL